MKSVLFAVALLLGLCCSNVEAGHGHAGCSCAPHQIEVVTPQVAVVASSCCAPTASNCNSCAPVASPRIDVYRRAPLRSWFRTRQARRAARSCCH